MTNIHHAAVLRIAGALALCLALAASVLPQEKAVDDKAKTQRDKDITDLCHAASLGKTAEVLELVKKVGNVNVHNPMDNKKSPLIKAIFSKNLDTVKALVENGADIHFPDGMNRFPMYFTHISSVEVMNYILSKGGVKDIDRYTCASEKNPYGNGKHVLGSVCGYQMGSPDMIAILVKAGANPDKKYGEEKVTPLIAAIINTYNRSGSERYVKALIEVKADVNLKDDRGMSPLQWARKKGNPEIVAILEKAGAKE